MTEQRLNMRKEVEWQSGKVRQRDPPASLWTGNIETNPFLVASTFFRLLK